MTGHSCDFRRMQYRRRVQPGIAGAGGAGDDTALFHDIRHVYFRDAPRPVLPQLLENLRVMMDPDAANPQKAKHDVAK